MKKFIKALLIGYTVLWGVEEIKARRPLRQYNPERRPLRECDQAKRRLRPPRS